MRRAGLAIVSAVLALAGLTAITLPGTAGAVPPALTNTLVASVQAPTAFDFLPDGALVVTNQFGKVFVVRGGTPTQVTDINGRICTNSERGLLGVAVDPSFVSNGYLYLYRTESEPTGTAPELSLIHI